MIHIIALITVLSLLTGALLQAPLFVFCAFLGALMWAYVREQQWLAALSAASRELVQTPLGLREYLECQRFRQHAPAAITGTARLPQSDSKVDVDSIPELLRHLREWLGQDAVAIVTNQNSEVSAYGALELRGRAFESELRLLSQPFFGGEQGFPLGLRDHAVFDGLFGNLQVFGFRYSWFSRLAYGTESALLWIGFPDGYLPSFERLRELELFSARAELELRRAAERRINLAELHELELESEERAQGLAHLSHDMRSPLNNIRSILHVATLEPHSPAQKELFDIALRSCDDLAGMIEDVLDLTKHRSGYLSAQKSDFDLAALLEEVAASFKTQAAQKGLGLELSLPESAPVNADQRQIKRVVFNLLGNAMKFTLKGRVRISLDVGTNDTWRLSVRDTGPGISESDQQKLFSPFVRVDRQGIEGTGLGLALSKVFVELNGGRISLDSRLGEGSEFACTLPQSASGVGIKLTERERQDFQAMVVLIVDDDPDCAQSLARLISAWGAKTHVAYSVESALHVLNFASVDLIVCDGQMPMAGGLEMLDQVGRFSSCAPVVILTGSSSEHQVYLEKGAIQVLTKPVEPAALMKIMSGLAATDGWQGKLRTSSSQ
jgi:signal transduction histidine kinase/ActR/RegA family two-component response regulator